MEQARSQKQGNLFMVFPCIYLFSQISNAYVISHIKKKKKKLPTQSFCQEEGVIVDFARFYQGGKKGFWGH